MFEFNKLIGLEKNKAIEILSSKGYKEIEIIINSKSNDLNDSLLVCKVEELNNKIILICGEFYLNIKG